MIFDEHSIPECFMDIEEGFQYMKQVTAQNELVGHIAWKVSDGQAEIILHFYPGVLNDRKGVTEAFMIEDAESIIRHFTEEYTDTVIRRIVAVTTVPCKIWNKVAERVFGEKPARIFVSVKEV